MNLFLRRCLELARLPGAIVEPNPRVGAVVVHHGRIIGEGFHQSYGGPHAEVNAIAAVRERALLPHSTIYVSLEPCNHQGKTPPCTDLILREGIPRVVIGSLDPNPQMAGRSVELLRSQGIRVDIGEDPAPFIDLNRHFWCNQRQARPYVTLKWAESADGFIAAVNAKGEPQRTAISDPQVSRGVHWLRHEHQAILIGRNTVDIDNPSLTTRKWPGHSPVRIFFDRQLQVSREASVYAAGGRAIVLNEKRNSSEGQVCFFRPEETEAWNDLGQMFRELYQREGIGSILVEGGATVHRQLLAQGVWDEAIRDVAPQALGKGVAAPGLPAGLRPAERHRIGGDWVERYFRTENG